MGQVLDLAAARERRGPGQAGKEPRLTKTEVAGHFRVSTRTISRWMGAGMPFDKPYEGGVPRFVLRDCEAWLRRRR